MALKILMLRKRLSDAEAKLRMLREKAASFITREADLEADIDAAQTEEEKEVVEAAISAFETEKDENAQAITEAEQEVSDLKAQIEEAESKAAEARNNPKENEKRSGNPMNKHETRVSYREMTLREAATHIIKEPEVKDFVSNTRDFLTGGQQRALNGAPLTVPEVMLDVVRDTISRYSKLITKVRYKPIKGHARQNIMGDIPEAVWTEIEGAFNEVNVSISQVEADAYKVAACICIPNAYLDGSSDIDLLAEVLDQLGQSVGFAVDKAIVYGTGTKMPVGFVTRIAAATKPSWWGTKQAAFTDLHTSNVKTLNLGAADGKSFFAPLLTALGIIRRKFATGEPVWLMNGTTHTEVSIKALEFNSSAALVSGVSKEMPVIGGEIIELPFIPDANIVGGYLSHYLLCERGGVIIRKSEHVRFLQDQLVAVAEALFDGKPLYGEAFVAVGYKNIAPSTSLSFAADTANAEAEG